MAQDTRERLLDQAEPLFAERGFYGVSIAAIANELGLTKQALLHHFGSKEKLYGEVLKRISIRFEEMDATPVPSDPADRLTQFLLSLHTQDGINTDATRILMRELLDNKRRADTAGAWYLKPFLEQLITMVQAIPNWQSASDAEALAMVYQLLGSINYFGISQPTLTGIFGEPGYDALEVAYPNQLNRLIRSAIASRP